MRIPLLGRKNAYIHLGTPARGLTQDATAGKANGLPAQALKLLCFGYHAEDTGTVATTVVGVGSQAPVVAPEVEPQAPAVIEAPNSDPEPDVEPVAETVAPTVEEPQEESSSPPEVEQSAPSDEIIPPASPEAEEEPIDYANLTERQLMSMSFD